MLLNTIKQKLKGQRLGRENGSDIIVTLFALPVVLAIVFSLIDVSTYFQTRAQVENITRDGARQVALYGGTSPSIPLNVQTLGGKDITATVLAKLWKNGNCTLSGCTKPPTVTCSPTQASSLSQDASCTVTYNYRSIGGALVSWLGFGNIVANQINITETFKVETRY